MQKLNLIYQKPVNKKSNTSNPKNDRINRLKNNIIKTQQNSIKSLENIGKKYSAIQTTHETQLQKLINLDATSINTNLIKMDNTNHFKLNPNPNTDLTVNLNFNNIEHNKEYNIEYNIEKTVVPMKIQEPNTNANTTNKTINTTMNITINKNANANANIAKNINTNTANTNAANTNANTNIAKNTNTANKNKFHTIYHVYQQTYKFNKNASGFGDFIRGAYFILEFCDLYNLNCIIKIVHPIKQFLQISQLYENRIDPDILENIYFYNNSNFLNWYVNEDLVLTKPNVGINYVNNFINYINKLPVYDFAIYTYNIVYSPKKPLHKHKQIIKNILTPNLEMHEYIDESLLNLSLIKHNYSVIHIRYGDMFLINNKMQLEEKYINQLKKEISEIIDKNKFKNTKYLLISDNIVIKEIIVKLWNNIFTLFTDISHLGEGVILETKKVKNTMLDFYLMSNANNIYAFSVYNHGSGFSQWCAETYDIPYICKILKIYE